MDVKALKKFPDVSFIDGMTIDEMKEYYLNAMREKYKELTGKELVMNEADPLRLIAYTDCLMLYQIAQYADRAGKMALLKYSFGDYLENIGTLKGISRMQGSAARTRLRFCLSMKRNNITIIPEGTRVTASDGIYFKTEEILEIPPGTLSGEVPAICKEEGTKGNGYGVGELKTMVDPVAYVESVENITVTEGGADLESDANLAERIYLAPSSWSTAGPDDAYKYWTKTYDAAISDVRVYSPEPGIVEIYFLLQNGQLPDKAMTDGLEKFLSEEDVRPLTDKVVVLAPEPDYYKIDLTYYINVSDRNRAAVIQEQVDTAIREYVIWQKTKIGRDINPDQLRSRIIAAGAKRVEVRSPTYKTIPKSSVAILAGAAEVIYGGVEDD